MMNYIASLRPIADVGVSAIVIERRSIMRLTTILLLALGLLVTGCRHDRRQQVYEKVWTVGELKAMEGKTREEINEMLGKPNGMLTNDPMGRWQFIDLLVSSEGTGPPIRCSMTIYFSESGDQRATVVEVFAEGKRL